MVSCEYADSHGWDVYKQQHLAGSAECLCISLVLSGERFKRIGILHE